MLVIEGSIPNEKINGEGYWSSFGNDEATGEPLTLNWWLDRLAPKAWGVVAVGTCATYGGIHAMAGNPTGCMGLADYLGWDFRSAGGLPIVNIPGCPVQPENFMETLCWLLYQAAGLAPDDPARRALRPQWIFGKTVHEGCDRAGYYEQGDFAQDYNSPKCLVKIGCWGPVVNCNVPKRGWMAGIGGCPNVGGICIGCTMPGFPDKFMPFMDAPPGGGHLLGGHRRLRTDDPQAARDHQQDDEQGDEVAPQPARADHRLQAALGLTSGIRPRAGEPQMAVTEKIKPEAGKLVDMAWDPITRIVGNLGIYTKIDFENREVVSCKAPRRCSAATACS